MEPLRFALDTNAVLGALERHESEALALLDAGRDGRAALALSLTFDDEFRGSFESPLWEYVRGLPRLSRPSAVWGAPVSVRWSSASAASTTSS